MKTDSEGNECPFCPENGKMNIIAYSASGLSYITKVLVRTDRGMVPAKGAYFVIPTAHCADYSELGFDFLKEVTELKRGQKLSFDNEGFNMTVKGGRKVEHLHYWLMKVHRRDQPFGLFALREKHRDLLRERQAAESRRNPWR